MWRFSKADFAGIALSMGALGNQRSESEIPATSEPSFGNWPEGKISGAGSPKEPSPEFDQAGILGTRRCESYFPPVWMIWSPRLLISYLKGSNQPGSLIKRPATITRNCWPAYQI